MKTYEEIEAKIKSFIYYTDPRQFTFDLVSYVMGAGFNANQAEKIVRNSEQTSASMLEQLSNVDDMITLIKDIQELAD